MTTRVGQHQRREYTVSGFGGGLNKSVSSFKLRDDELRDCQNVRFGLSGSLKVRGGMNKYETSGLANQKEPRAMMRYNRSDDTSHIILQTEDELHVDNGSGAFTNVGTVLTGSDGFVDFAQWNDTVFIANGQGTPQTYNSDGSLLEATVTGAIGDSWMPGYFDLTATGTDGRFPGGKDYAYRVTFDVYNGDDYLGETFPIHNGIYKAIGGLLRWQLPWDGFQDIYWCKHAVPTANQRIDITRGAGALIGDTALPSYVKTINIYRSVGNLSDNNDEQNYKIIAPICYYLGSFSKDDYNDAEYGDVLLADYGDPPNGDLPLETQFNKEEPPISRYIAVHKNRMWYGNVKDTILDNQIIKEGQYFSATERQTNENARVYFSEYLAPLSVRYTSSFDIGIHDGEGITKLVSWKNRALFAFKPNSIWGIFGGDNEAVKAVPDFELENIDEAVGCIAPRSLAFGEGAIMFLSNRGVQIFDGTRSAPLFSQKIDTLLAKIPSTQREKACGVYVNKTRKYYLAVSTSDEDSSRKNVVFEFDFFTRTWARHVYRDETANTFGFNSFIEFKRSDEVGKVLAAIDKAGTVQTTTGAVQELDEVFYETISTDGIPWDASTKFYDCKDPHMKTFVGVIVRAKSPQTITVNYNVDEDTIVSTTPLTVTSTSTHAWNESGLNWQGADPVETSTHVWTSVTQGETLVRFPQNVRGRRISLIFSGDANLDGTEIQGFTIIYLRDPSDE